MCQAVVFAGSGMGWQGFGSDLDLFLSNSCCCRKKNLPTDVKFTDSLWLHWPAWSGQSCSLYVLNLKLSYYAHYQLSFFYFETPELDLHNSQFENILINLILALHAATQFNLCLKQAVFSGPPHLKSPLSSAWPTFACWLAAPTACEHCFDPLPLCSTAYDHFRNSAWTIAIWSTEFD